MMSSLSCQNIDLSRTQLDLVACQCSSNRKNARWVYRATSNTRVGAARKLICTRHRAIARCSAFSAKTPEAMLNVVTATEASVLDAKSESINPISISLALEVVADDLQTLNKNLKSIVGAENPVLISAAEQIFGAGGKRMRPALVFLVSRATAELVDLKELTPRHCRLAEIIEMIHTASLFHDDVLDDSNM